MSRWKAVDRYTYKKIVSRQATICQGFSALVPLIKYRPRAKFSPNFHIIEMKMTEK